MAIVFKCSCGRELKVKDGLAGKKGKCPSCGKILLVPMAQKTPKPAATAKAEVPAAASTPEPEAETEMKNCVHCGQSIPADAIFCIHCGTHLRTGKKAEVDQATAEEEEYNFFKTAPDLLTKPLPTMSTIVEAQPSVQAFKKALIFFAVGMVFFTLAVPFNNELALKAGVGQGGLSIWAFVLAFFLGLVVTVTDGLIANIGGTMFGSTGTGFANSFMGVLAARAMIGLVLGLFVLYHLFMTFQRSSGNVYIMLAGMLVVRFGWGTLLMYCLMLRAYDCGPVPAIVFAALTSVVQAMLFWIPSLFGIRLLY